MYYLTRFKAGPGFVYPDEVMPVSPPSGWYFDEPLAESMPEVIVTVANLTSLTDSWGIGCYECASMRMLRLLETIGDTHYEIYPLAIADREGSRDSESFRVIRFRDRVKCMDMANSEYKLSEEGYVNRIRRLAIHEVEIPPRRHFFRLSERPTVQLASEHFTARWVASGLTGLEFIPLNRINYWF